MALIAEQITTFPFPKTSRVLIHSESQEIEFEHCFRPHGIRMVNPSRNRCSFDEVLALHDFVTRRTPDDGIRSSAIVTRQGVAQFNERYEGYEAVREFLIELTADRIDRGSWMSNPNVTEPLVLALIYFFIYLFMVFGIATAI